MAAEVKPQGPPDGTRPESPPPDEAAGRDEILRELAARGLPEWLLVCLRKGLSHSCAVDALTDASLERAGIRHPLHRRRILRELAVLRPASALVSTPSPPAPEEVSELSIQRVPIPPAYPPQRPPRRHRVLIPLDEFRWPYLDPPPGGSLPCAPKQRRRSKRKTRLSWLHAPVTARVDTRLRTVKRKPFIPKATDALDVRWSCSGVDSEEASASDVSPGAIQCYAETGDSARRIPGQGDIQWSRTLTPVVQEEFFLDWDSWMETRLHPMKIVDDLVVNAVAGKVQELQQSKLVAERQGEDFVRSLQRTPCPKQGIELWQLMRGEIGSDDADGGDRECSRPRWLWEWVAGRLDDLLAADAQLAPLVETAEEVLLEVHSTMQPKRALQSFCLPGLAQNKWRNVNGSRRPTTGSTAAGSYIDSTGPSNRQQSSAMRHASWACEASSPPAPASAGGHRLTGLPCPTSHRRTALSGEDVVSRSLSGSGRKKSQAGRGSNHDRQVLYSNMQDQIASASSELSETLAALDRSLGAYVSAVRASADEVLRDLGAAEAKLFVEYLHSVEDREIELRSATEVDSATGVVDLGRLEEALVSAQSLIGAETFLGERVMRLAEDAGVGFDGLCEEPSGRHWSAIVRDPPPWQGAFEGALQVFLAERALREDPHFMETASALAGQIQRLRVTIFGARNLRQADWCDESGRQSDPYCVCEIVGQGHARGQTQVVRNDADPMWNFTMEFDRITARDTLQFSVWDSDEGAQEADDPLGSTFITGVQALCGFSGELLIREIGTSQRCESYLKVRTEALPP
mmetsp:Transcript_88617/g.255560  ORF Transcript_88617/g.255560 Transcript_88617/m.255560 type:complete len:802 (-) Transcript_88617:437-2842(-)